MLGNEWIENPDVRVLRIIREEVMQVLEDMDLGIDYAVVMLRNRLNENRESG
jgi:antitoxin component of RelBE/YafQ-DinJ toxin-antitoxin module